MNEYEWKRKWHNRLRFWLLRKIAGSWSVMINVESYGVKFVGGDNYAFMADCWASSRYEEPRLGGRMSIHPQEISEQTVHESAESVH